MSRSKANLAGAAARLAAQDHKAFYLSADLSQLDAGERIAAAFGVSAGVLMDMVEQKLDLRKRL